MALWNNFPYSNVHELNLDWIIEKMKYLIDQWESYGTEVDADAVAGLTPDVSVEGDLKTGLTFHFTLVQGPQGDEGPQGVSVTMATMDANYQLTLYFSDGTTWTSPSLKGATGSGLQILDEYATLAALQAAHPTGDAGDAYLVGTSPNFTLYIWSTSGNAWVDGGALTNPSPSITTPLMNGIADAGTELAYSRGNHVHPSDTSKQDVLTAGTGIDITGTTISVNAAIPAPSNSNPLMDSDSPDPGSSSNYSRADHVHKAFSYVGMVIQSTLPNASDIQAVYGSDTSWVLLSSVILTSENVKGNGLTLGITEGSNLGGYSVNRNIYQSSYGQNAGNTTNTGAFSGSGSIGVANGTQLGITPENSGIIVDTAVVYTWERTA